LKPQPQLRPEPKAQEPFLIPLSSPNKRQHSISRRGLAASTPNQPRTILTRSQLLECADAYTNDGIMRRLVNTLVFGIKGERIKFVVDLNEELTEFASDEELKTLQESILKDGDIDNLKRKLIRVNKRVQFNDRIDTFLKSFFVFGRGLSQIIRFPRGSTINADGQEELDAEWPVYGEPRAIRPLNSIRIIDVQVNETTGELDGVTYDYGQAKRKVIKPIDMIFGVNDDNNLYDNTNFSGMSPVWTCLSASQSNIVINDEDIPEATRSFSGKFGLLYAGTSKKSTIRNLADLLAQGAWVVHNQANLKAEVHDLARDLMELPNVRESGAKYMTWCTMVPLFLIFEDTANFATANQALAAWHATTITYYRTIVQGILEKYWYDPMLADHFGIDVKDVIAERIKVKPVFEDLIFDTYKDTVEAINMLVQSGVYTPEQALEKLGEDKFLEQNREIQDEVEKAKEESINEAKEDLQKGINNAANIQFIKAQGQANGVPAQNT